MKTATNDSTPVTHLSTFAAKGFTLVPIDACTVRPQPLSRNLRLQYADRLRSARIDGDIATAERCERVLAGW